MKATNGCMTEETVFLCKRVSSGSCNIPVQATAVCYIFLLALSWWVELLHVHVTQKMLHPNMLLAFSGEATRLQQLEVQVLGESSTGFKPSEAAQQSPGMMPCESTLWKACTASGSLQGSAPDAVL